MKRLWTALLLLALLAGAIPMPALAETGPAAPEGEIARLWFYRGGYMAPRTLELTDDEEGVWARIDGEPAARPDARFRADLADCVAESGALAWNGFHGSDPRVLDGESFSLEIAWENGFTLTAGGDNAFPAGYYSFCDALERAFEAAAERACTLSFSSFEGGGLEFSVEIADTDTLTYGCRCEYEGADDVPGAAYRVVYTFQGLRPGGTSVAVVGSSPIAPMEKQTFAVTVTDGLRVIIEKEETMEVLINGTPFTAVLEDNETARAFRVLLPLELEMEELNGNEKYHYLDAPLPSAPEAVGGIQAGDIMLYGDRCVVVFYRSFDTPYSYTRIGRIVDAQALSEAAGAGDALALFR